MSAPRARRHRRDGHRLAPGVALAIGALLLVACGRSDDAPDAAADRGAAQALPPLAGTAGFDDRDNPASKSGDSGALRVDRIDPCALLTREEAETIVRTRLLDARPANVGGDRPSCTYGADPAGTTAQVQVFVGDGAESLIAVNRGLGGDNIEVGELGDGAFLRHTTLHFHAAGVPVVLSVVRLVDAKTLHPAMIAAARTIAGRMASPPPPAGAGADAALPAGHAADARLQAGEARYRP